MKIICSTCKYEYDENDSKKCPRCGSIAQKPSGCGSCRGCSLWKVYKPG